MGVTEGTGRWSPTIPAGESGRGEHVLFEKHRLLSPPSPSSKRLPGGGAGQRRSSWDGLRPGKWGTALYEVLQSHGNPNGTKKRGNGSTSQPSSRASSRTSMRTKVKSSTGGSGLGGGGGGSTTTTLVAEQVSRSPSPPLTIDDITTASFNPFPLFHIRWHLLPEVLLLTFALLFALYRISSIPNTIFATSPFATSSASSPASPPPSTTLFLPLLLLLTFLTPFISLLRRPTSYLKVPFTDERGYRDPSAADDGIAAAIVLPLLLASACLWDTWKGMRDGHEPGLGGIRPLVDVWESRGVHAKSFINPDLNPFLLSQHLSSTTEMWKTLLKSRIELVLLTTLNAVVLLFHLFLAKFVLRIEKLSKSNTKRFFGFMVVAWAISLSIWGLMGIWDWKVGGLPISPLECAATTLIQQSSFYVVSRLARRGFTLGELNLMTSAGNALCLEFWRLSSARWYYKRGYPGVPETFRSPSPILVFQTVLIPGAFLSGFLLSPLLVISRHIASKPSHRLKWPTERERHRRLLAAGVFLGLFGIVFFMLGGWAGWMLGGGLRRPWLWAFSIAFYGRDGVETSSRPKAFWTRWKRLFLLAYWAAAIVTAVGGWQTRLVRARRIRMKNGEKMGVGMSSTTMMGGAMGMMTGVGVGAKGETTKEETKVGVEGAREEKRFHASLNMRRKFFHALAVTMFVPGMAIDPSFTSLAFSAAFALFTFSEYARYFALYPIGAPLHIFFSEFVDSKDSGPVILSHFYLLTGCAGGLWLEGTGVNRYTGVLVLGVGDAMASIVGKLAGRVRWPKTSKTVEGTIAFVVSILFTVTLMRFAGMTGNFSMPRYALATTLAALVEASSSQNDNLVIPIYMWSMVTLLV